MFTCMQTVSYITLIITQNKAIIILKELYPRLIVCAEL